MNAEEGEGDLGDVAMPGFIDILSSVITVFMFFMLITSAIMFFMSVAMKKSAQEESAKQTESKVSKEVQDYIKKVEAGEITLKEMTSKLQEMEGPPVPTTGANTTTPAQAAAAAPVDVDNSQQGRATFGRSTSQKVTYDTTFKDMTVVFADKGIAVSDDTAKSMGSFVDKLQASNGKPVVVDIDVPDNPNAATLSISREVALGRMLNVRNVLLAHKVTGNNISVHNVPASSVDDSYDWVKIHVHQ